MIPSRSNIRSSGFEKRRRTRTKVRAAAFFVFILFFTFGSVVFFRLPELRIDNIIISGEEIVKEEEITSKAESLLEGSYWRVFPRRNIFLYPRNEIESALLENPKIKSANVAFSDFESIEIEIRERKPFALWCGNEFYEGPHDGRCFFTDDTGFIFSKAPDFSGGSFPVFFGGNFTGNSVGASIANDSLFFDLIFFKKEVENFVGSIDRIHLKSTGLIDLYLKGGGKIILNDKQNFGIAAANLKVLVENESFEGKDSAGNLNIEYIDLQNPEKVFYKVK